jgi:uncharacterized protein YlbG (UPF0298 family)
MKLRTLSAVIPEETIDRVNNYVRKHNIENPMNKINQSSFVHNALLAFLKEMKAK